jgi:hypothetical protein
VTGEEGRLAYFYEQWPTQPTRYWDFVAEGFQQFRSIPEVDILILTALEAAIATRRCSNKEIVSLVRAAIPLSSRTHTPDVDRRIGNLTRNKYKCRR